MTFKAFVDSIVSTISSVLVPAVISLAFAAFMWGMFNYFFLHENDEKSRTDGRNFALYGILGFVVIFSIWGIVNMLLSTLGIAPK
jgi:hypothetical protein